MDEKIKLALEKQNPWWFNRSFDTGVPRLEFYPELHKYLKTPEVLLILGARRTGKSTLAYQLIKTLSVQPESILFINLDEPLFQSKSDDPEFLTSLIEEYTVEQKNVNKFYIFIDEIQNYSYWVQTIKTFHDVNKNLKFVLIGSTSSLLKSAMSIRLSGRYFSTTIYPLNFKEFFLFNDVKKPTIQQKKQLFGQYLKLGGFPRVVLEKDKQLKQDILKNYFQTIYLKDIIYPHKLRNNKDVFDLLYFAISNIGKPLSYRKIAQLLNISLDTVKEYLLYAEESYLLFLVRKYDPSVKKQLVNPQKVYCIDTGLINAVSFKFSENKGRILENLVFMALQKNYDEIFYHKDKSECDFLIKKGAKIITAIQVSLTLKDPDTRKRELKGILEAIHTHKLKEGIILTEKEEETIINENKKIYVKPVYKWLEEF
ncbi:MAG: ATP-binding protein [Candidatus Woesearchaeota archaeon]